MKPRLLPNTIIQDTSWYREWVGFWSFLVPIIFVWLVRKSLAVPIIDRHVLAILGQTFSPSITLAISRTATCCIVYFLLVGMIMRIDEWIVKRHDDEVWATTFSKEELQRLEFADQVYYDYGTNEEKRREIKQWRDELLAQKKIRPLPPTRIG